MKPARLYIALLAACAAVAALVWSLLHSFKPAMPPQQAYQLQQAELEAIAQSTPEQGSIRRKYDPPANFVVPQLEQKHVPATTSAKGGDTK